MKLSVCLITFNHVRYVSQAIESVLMQQVDGGFELVIGEDCSEDGTRDLVLGYQQRFPTQIRVVLQDSNRGDFGKTNAVQTLAACQGEYVACLDGDDYWTSPHKLQNQMDFLDARPEYSMCVHNMRVLSDTKMRGKVNPFPKPRYTFEDLVKGVHLAHSSAMFRSGLVPDFPDWFFDPALMNGDTAYFLLHAQHGDIGYLREVMGVYRLHAGGLWTTLDKIGQVKANMATRRLVDAAFDYQYHKQINQYLRRHDIILALLYFLRGRPGSSFRSLRSALSSAPEPPC